MTAFSGQIRDSLYGLIPISIGVRAVLQQPAFLRLDGIQQLGFASRVWPGAKHTRLEHSLGVMHLTDIAVQHLRSLPEGCGISEEDAQVVVAAALLHDIGHYPFSHAIEELGSPVRSHEEVGHDLIVQGEIAACLQSVWNVDPLRVAAMIHGNEELLAPNDRLLRGLLSGTLDMDKLDYLPRDARACNVPYGGVDWQRLISSLTILDIPEGERRIGIGSKGISPLHSLINARQEMFDNVYWHHTNRACMVMLLRAIQDALAEGCVAADSLTNHEDASLLAMLQGEAMPESTRMLAEALSRRDIHKRAVEISARASELYGRLSDLWYDQDARRAVEVAMTGRLQALTSETVDSTSILIDIPKSERWKTDVWVRFDRPPVGMSSTMHWQDVVGISDVDLKRYEEHRRLIRLVVDARFAPLVSEHWESLLNPSLGGSHVE